MQLLVLKMLYILFNTKGLSEYFYTNDLCVLVDVFLREIVDLDEESESVCLVFNMYQLSNINNIQLRHTYLRVLHPLLTKTQLRSLPYKRSQIVRALESLVENPEIREVSSTTKRLVERCLSGEWCVQHRTPGNVARVSAEPGLQRTASPSSDFVAAQSLTPKFLSTTVDPSLSRRRSLKGSRSAENLRGLATANTKPASRALEAVCKPAKDSSLSLAVASQPNTPASHHHQSRAASETLGDKRLADRRQPAHPLGMREVNAPVRHNSLETGAPMSPVRALVTPPAPPSPLIPASVRSSETRLPSRPASGTASGTSTASGTKKIQRRSPPPPPKRRKPPAVPMRLVGTSNSGAQIAAIASSTSAPALGKT
jgi:hypothetical protein